MTAAASLPTTFDEASVDRFGFGRNWLDYQTSIDQARLLGARQDIEQWLGVTSLRGLRVLDIGSGSGVHSYCMHALGADTLVSFDYDADSVQATREFHAKAGAPASWTVLQGSVLDAAFMESLGTFDLVYSWGVLHHTGQMWQAISHAAARVAIDGRFFISIYAKGPQYPSDLALKQRYHRASLSGKRRMEFEWILQQYQLRARQGLAPEGWWTEGRERGMDPYYDLVDWLGGLPYEVATLAELTTALRAMGIVTQRTRECGDGGCHILVARRTSVPSVIAPVFGGTLASSPRHLWPSTAAVVWLGAFDSADAPERVVPLAHALPQIPFLMLASRYAALDAETRQALEALAPNLTITECPSDAAALYAVLHSAGVLLHTADGGPSRDWLAMASCFGVPVAAVDHDAAREIERHGLGVTGDGSVDGLGAGLAALRTDRERYVRASISLLARSQDARRG